MQTEPIILGLALFCISIVLIVLFEFIGLVAKENKTGWWDEPLSLGILPEKQVYRKKTRAKIHKGLKESS